MKRKWYCVNCECICEFVENPHSQSREEMPYQYMDCWAISTFRY
jgi:hypothetical protein